MFYVLGDGPGIVAWFLDPPTVTTFYQEPRFSAAIGLRDSVIGLFF